MHPTVFVHRVDQTAAAVDIIEQRGLIFVTANVAPKTAEFQRDKGGIERSCAGSILITGFAKSSSQFDQRDQRAA
jgi:hypothetical protein